MYRLGMAMYKLNPNLWSYGIAAITLPDRLSSAIQSIFREKRRAGKINTVNLELTMRCNLRCGMCWWWGENGIGFKLAKEKTSLLAEELSTKQIFDVVDQLERQRPSFYLSGGEPFIRQDTVEIIKYISDRGMSVIMNDNGTLLTENVLREISKIRNLTINFSIDGPKEVHDRIRGKGTFDKTAAAIRRLIELRGDSAYPAVKTNTTFSPLILGKIDGLIRYLQDDVGVDAVRMQHMWFTDQKHADLHKKALKEVFGVEDDGAYSHVMPAFDRTYIDRLSDEVLKVEKTRYSKPVFIHPQLTKEQILEYYTDLSFTGGKRCGIAWSSIVIKANGDVMFCPDEWMTKFKLGNVKTATIADMWNGEAAGRFREEIYERKMLPACARCCAMSG